MPRHPPPAGSSFPATKPSPAPSGNPACASPPPIPARRRPRSSKSLARYPDLYAEWSVNEKVSMEVALGASMTGSRAFCAMKHVGMNVASDCLMTMTITGAYGGLVIAVADDVGMSSSQNEQDSRFWGRFAHMPVLEPADSQEAYEMTKVRLRLLRAIRGAGAAAPDHAHLPRQGPGQSSASAKRTPPAGFKKNPSAG
jgi:hypothetical protein